MLIAETDEKPQDAKKYFGNGDECHMAFNFYLAMKTWLALKRKDLSISYKAGEEAHDIPENCRWGTFLTNHDAFALYLLDEKEKLEIANWLDPECKFSSSLGSTTSMRVAEVFKGDKSNIISAFKTLLNLSGTPIIYYGEEVGMRNMQFKEKPAETRLFIRGDFDWKEAERQLTEENSLLNEISILMNRYKFEIRF